MSRLREFIPTRVLSFHDSLIGKVKSIMNVTDHRLEGQFHQWDDKALGYTSETWEEISQQWNPHCQAN